MMKKIVDLRSDTVTRPGPGMLEAMYRAEVDDDCIGKDPTTQRLEEMAAGLLGKEAALFVPTASMGNQICVKAYTRPGQQILCSETAHVALMEVCMAAAFSGVQPRLVHSPDGYLTAEAARECLYTDRHYHPETGLICVENTMNSPGGRIFPQAEITKIAELCLENGLPLHMDGARLFNAAVATGIPAKDIVASMDCLACCLSKGLGTPVGALVAGTRDFIRQAMRIRQMMGGGMRQTGYLAAAGIYALENNIDRLAEDHANARALAEGLLEIDGMKLDLDSVETNMVYFDPTGCGTTAEEFTERMTDFDIRLLFDTEPVLRIVTHLDVTREDVARFLEAAKEIVRQAS